MDLFERYTTSAATLVASEGTVKSNTMLGIAILILHAGASVLFAFRTTALCRFVCFGLTAIAFYAWPDAQWALMRLALE